jgi:hypothetical protein
VGLVDYSTVFDALAKLRAEFVAVENRFTWEQFVRPQPMPVPFL